MPGQLNLTGANAAVQLVGNDTITEDQEFVFPDTGGTVVTSDSDGNVDLDGDLTVTGDIKAGAGTQGGTVGAQLFPSGGVTARNSDSSAQVFGGYKSDNSSPTFSVTGNGSITTVSKGTFGTGLSGASTVIAVGPDNDRKAEINRNGSAKLQGKIDIGDSSNPITDNNALVAQGSNDSTGNKATIYARQWTNAGRNYIGINKDGAATFEVFANGNITGNVTRVANVELKLDPNNPAKVLDVKESIRNMQAALYRLKAAVLIPNASVDEMRLRILEALETITEEVD